MSKLPLRAAVALAVVLGLAAFTAPGLGGAAPDAAPSPEVRAAAATAPIVVGTVEQATAPHPGRVLAELTERIAADVAAAEEAAAIEAYVAAREAAALERLAAAEEARKAEEARRAEAARAAAPGSIDEIIQRHFGAAAPTARRIARCESSYDPRAVSPTDDHGLFQINAVHRGQFEAVTGAPWSAVYDPELNTRYARWLYGQQGWSPWSCA